VEVLVNRKELSMQSTISLEQALGFSLYMIRAVLSGRGYEVIDPRQDQPYALTIQNRISER
jgi:pyruvate dehydrogenase (quinone)